MTKSNDVLKIKIIWQSIKNMPYNRKAWSNLYTFYVQRDWRWHIDYVAEQLVRFEVPLPISQKAAINKSRRKKRCSSGLEVQIGSWGRVPRLF